MRFSTRRTVAIAAVSAMLVLAGCDSNSDPEYSRAYLTRLSITVAPLQNPQGQAWDPLGGNPDPMFILYDANNVELARGTAYQDVSQSGYPLGWAFTPAYEITDFNRSYYIALWDADVDAPDLMGKTGTFRMADLKKEGYPTHKGLHTGSILAELDIEWAE